MTSLITTLPLLPPTVIFISHPNQLFSTYLGLHFPLFSSPKPTTTTPSHSRLAQALLIYLVDVKKKKKKPKLCCFGRFKPLHFQWWWQHVTRKRRTKLQLVVDHCFRPEQVRPTLFFPWSVSLGVGFLYIYIYIFFFFSIFLCCGLWLFSRIQKTVIWGWVLKLGKIEISI